MCFSDILMLWWSDSDAIPSLSFCKLVCADPATIKSYLHKYMVEDWESITSMGEYIKVFTLHALLSFWMQKHLQNLVCWFVGQSHCQISTLPVSLFWKLSPKAFRHVQSFAITTLNNTVDQVDHKCQFWFFACSDTAPNLSPTAAMPVLELANR